MAAAHNRTTSSAGLIQELIDRLSSSLQNPSVHLSIDAIAQLNNDLQQIRHLLVDSGSSSRTKDAFRRARGFEFLLQALSIFAGALAEAKSIDLLRTEQFEILKSCLLVISEALRDHSINHLHFSSSAGINGWSVVETALSDLVELGRLRVAQQPVESVYEVQWLFGLLLAVALCEDSYISFFKKHQIDLDADKPAAEQSAAQDTDVRDQESADTGIRTGSSHLNEPSFRSTDFVRNPEVISLIYSLWWKLRSSVYRALQDERFESGPAGGNTGVGPSSNTIHLQLLSSHVLLALKGLVKASEFNILAIHKSNVLRPILETYISGKTSSRESSALESIANELLSLGMNDLDDAAYLFSAAEDNAPVAEKLLGAIKLSRQPHHFLFDMSMHGYASLEFTELSKSFPPIEPSFGYTLTAWIYVKSFDDNCHITLFGAFDEGQTCFVLVYMESSTRQLVLQTSISSPNPSTRFKSVTFEPGRWYHVSLLHHAARNSRPSRASLFINGRFVEQRRCPYPESPLVSASRSGDFRSSSNSTQAVVQCFFGTPQDLSPRLGSAVLSAKWALAAAHLFTEILSEELILVFFQMGPSYSGNFQDSLGSFQTYRASTQLNLINEDKNGPGSEHSKLANAVKLKANKLNLEKDIAISISPTAVIALNDTKFLQIANPKIKSRLQEHFNSASNDLVVNSSIPLFSRALTKPAGCGSATGGTVNFRPLSLEDCCWRLCGCMATSLKLVAEASTSSKLLTAVEILFQLVQENWRNSEAMERGNGFGILSWILRMKLFQNPSDPQNLIKPLIDPINTASNLTQTFQDLFALIMRFLGVDLNYTQKSLLNNPLAYRQLVVDYRIWERSDRSTQMLYFNQFIILTSKSQYSGFNARRLNRMRIVKKFIELMKDRSMDEEVLPVLMDSLKALVECNFTTETLRSLALYITFAVSAEDGTSTGHAKLRLPEDTACSTVTPTDLGIRTLEMLASIICNVTDNGRVQKFARTITVKWLLNLLSCSDPRVMNAVLKILVHAFLATDFDYLAKFREKDGFLILRQTLPKFWTHSEIWLHVWQLLLGINIAIFDEDGRSPSSGLLKAIEMRSQDEFSCHEMAAVLLAMIQSGLEHRFKILKHLASEPESTQGADTTKPEEPYNYQNVESAVKVMVLLHGLKPFRNLSTSHNFTRDLLVVLFNATRVCANDQRNLGGSDSMDSSTVTSQIVNTPEGSRNKDLPNPSFSKIVLESQGAIESSSPTQRTRRSSSFVMVSSKLWSKDSLPGFTRILAPNTQLPDMSLFEDSLCQQLIQLLVCVLVDQIINDADFSGLGLFLKAPPDTMERRSSINSLITIETIRKISVDLAANLELLHEPRHLTNITRFAQQTYEAVLEGWYLGGSRPLFNFLAIILEHLNEPAVRVMKVVRLCSPSISALQGLFRHLTLYYLLTETRLETHNPFDQTAMPQSESELREFGSADRLDPLRDLSRYIDLIAPTQVETPTPFAPKSDVTLLPALCYLLCQKILDNDQHESLESFKLLSSIVARTYHELQHVVSKRDLSVIWAEFLQKLFENSDNFFAWVAENREQIGRALNDSPRATLVQFMEKENTVSRSLSTSRVSKREQRLNQQHLNELAEQHAWTEYNSATKTWAGNIYNSEIFKQLRARQDDQDAQEYLASLYRKCRELAPRNVAVGKPASDLRWRLDGTEGRSRMRLRLYPSNDSGDLEYRPKRRQTLSHTSQISHSPSPSRTGASTPQQRHSTQDVQTVKDQASEVPSTPNEPSVVDVGPEEFEMIRGEESAEGEAEDKNRKVMRSLQRGEKVRDVYNVSQIHGLEAQETLLIVGEKSLYLLSNLFQRSDGEIVNVWQAPPEERDPYTQMITGRKVKRQKTIPIHDVDTGTRHWPWAEIISVSKRRFLSRPVALEIFFQDGRSYLLTASSEESRNALYTVLLGRAVKLRSSLFIDEDLWRTEFLPNPRETPQTVGSRLVSAFNLGSILPATTRWVKGEISNFQYLMIVNTMAGRTFNDLTQYPVFPWVIADYNSNVLDLSNPRTYRDLTKPMGCQSPDREVAFKERYKAFEDMSDHSTPAFHYGTHYSTAMIVTSYLIRLQPFVDSYLLLQGGNFDHADRLFYSIEKTWLSASQETMTDVRELTPEFYYLPDFLSNINKYDFGLREANGERINDVTLPPWAKGDPELFIAKNREALESPYVSQNLHSWIDLVFGFRQRGEPAVDAINVFHHLSYQDATDLETMDDLHERLATIGIIHNFGQTPTQVFTRPHERREYNGLMVKKLPRLVNSLSRLPEPVYEHHSQISQLEYATKQQRLLCCGSWRTFMASKYGVVMDWGHSDHSVRFYNSDSRKMLGLCEQLHQDVITNARFVHETLITTSYDCTVGVWNVLMGTNNVDLQHRGMLFAHRHPVMTLSISQPLSTILSADLSGRVILWDLNSLDLVRQIDNKREVQYACVNNTNGHIILCCDQRIVMYTLNGKLLLEQSICVLQNDRISCCSFYENTGNEYMDTELIFTGHRWGVVNAWRLVFSQNESWKLELVRRLDHIDRSTTDRRNLASAITAICPLDQVLYTGDEEGRVFEWACAR